jgi:hypothetical protein
MNLKLSFFQINSNHVFLRNFVAILGLGKAGVTGAGISLVLLGYADLARPVLPANLLAIFEHGVALEAVASAGGLLGIIVALVASILR